MRRRVSLEGKVVAITGAGHGIGRQVAIVLARRGARLALCGRRREPLEETRDLVQALGGSAVVTPADVCSRDAMDEWARSTDRHYGQVDVVISNAGTGVAGGPVDQVTYEHLVQTVEVNFWGCVHTSLAFLPHLRKRPWANLTITASAGALVAAPFQVGYCASKFAVRGFAESVRADMAGSNIDVSLVFPGVVRETEVFRSSLGASTSAAQTVDQRMQRLPFATTAEGAARRIAHGIERRRPRMLIGPDAVALDALGRVAPGLYLHMGLLARRLGALTDG